ncbi:MAG: chemotaxis protein CheW, partial [Oscillospiraceae bacterium]|nr:chemotaxis protein CheW [Oscillospiraceae bacterium]
LVKNSADHGLEAPDRRASLGKPPKGRLTLAAYMRDGSAVIEVRDDGAGIDAIALRRKMVERGLAGEEQAMALSDAEAYGLIFEPGMSTAKNVTSLSGRGVGMDIVKTNIERLGGGIEIDSTQGVGTTMRLMMPLTLSAVRALIVTIDEVRYAVPESNVDRLVRVRKGSPEKRVERLGGHLTLVCDGRAVPLVTFQGISAKVLGEAQPPVEGQLERITRREVAKFLVMKFGERRLALHIDEALETEQTLVKPLSAYLKDSVCYSGTTVLGSGEAIMILDAGGIVRLMDIEYEEAPQVQGGPDAGLTRQVIVFQCSGPEHFALDMGAIRRIETIRPSQVQRVGDSLFVNVASSTVRVLRPEDHAPVSKAGYAADKLYVITLKGAATPVGLLAGRIVDKVEGEFKVDGGRITGEHVLGTSAYGEKVLIFLDPASMAELAAAEPSMAELAAAEPALVEPVLAEPTAVELAAVEPFIAEPAMSAPAGDANVHAFPRGEVV